MPGRSKKFVVLQAAEECMETTLARLGTGVAGLDEILGGGLIAGRAYMVRGGPGTGKTMLGLHFLAAGAAAGEPALCISLEEPEPQLRQDAVAVGIDLGGVDFLDLSPEPEFFAEGKFYDIFTPAEVEREPTTRKIIECVELLKPKRVFLDAITQFRYLCGDDFQFHKQVLSFIHFLRNKGVTLLMTCEGSIAAPDDDLQFLSDGVLHLEFSGDVRSLEVSKFRSADFQSGKHTMRLTGGGMRVYPRLVPERHGREFASETVPSGIPELDQMLHGGLERGTVTIVTGPSGVGKTTLASYFMTAAAARGERSVLYTFEERVETILRRSEALKIPLRALIARNDLSIVPIEPLRYTPDEFSNRVRRDVEERQARLVMLDSVTAYGLRMPGQEMVSHVHSLCAYLRNMGVSGILVNEINEIEAITGVFRATESGIGYLADNILFLRYVEVHGELRRAIGVLKKRLSGFESSLREIALSKEGLKVGPPLTGLHGLLSGVPQRVGGAEAAAREVRCA